MEPIAVTARAPAHAPARPPTGPIEPAALRRLRSLIDEPATTLLVVFGRGPEADQSAARCRQLAREPLFGRVRVARVRDVADLPGEARARWGARPGRLVVLRPDRSVAATFDRPDAVDLFVAVAAAAA